MWRQMRVDQAYLARIRKAMLALLLRGNLFTMVAFALLAALMVFLAATGGEWLYAFLGIALALMLPLLLWRSAARAGGNLPPGSFVAYAVTPDGTFHVSNASGTTTVNPGFVTRIAASPDCWLIALGVGIVVVPRELIPDADAALLVRHLPGALKVPPAVRPVSRTP